MEGYLNQVRWYSRLIGCTRRSNSAAKSPGRWNATGEAVLYSAPTISMAVLETAAHIDDSGLPLNRYLLELDVPDGVWALRAKNSMSWRCLRPGQRSQPATRA